MQCTCLPDIGLSDLLKRTEVDGDHLLWTAHATHGRFPQWRIGPKCFVVRRLVWQLTRGTIPKGLQIGVKCGEDLCVHPDCLVARTKSKIMTGTKKTAATKLRIAIARRAGSKLNLEIVNAIRASGERGDVVEAQYGLRQGYASRIRTGRVWADHSNPFAGLGAKAAR